MLLRKVAKHPQVGRRHDCNECTRNDPRAIPAVEEADIVSYRPIYFIAIFGNGARNLFTSM
jgi:hypothetical protein